MGAHQARPTLLDDSPITPEPEAGALVRAETGDMLERLARDPNVSVDKLERLIAMRERVMAHTAKAAFDAAFTLMQADLPEISENGQIKKRDGSVQSRYAKLEDIQTAVKPVLKQHHFSIRHRTEWPADKPNVIRVVGILSHEQGHSETSTFEAPMDKSDYRSDIQSMGSTVSYGRRYTMLDLLNITTRGADNDGQSGKAEQPEPPQGYPSWLSHLTTIAQKGQQPFDAAWETSDAIFKTYAVNHDRDNLNQLRRTAATSGRARR